MNRNILVIFARFPEPGKVKTRLAAKVGPEEACRIYEEMLRAQIREHRDRDYDLVVFLAPSEKNGNFAGEFSVPTQTQRGEDLGARMADCFENLLRDYDGVAIVGSDIPGLTSSHVAEAFERAGEVDVVLGPCPDGGYYLIASQFQPDVFDGIPWSTDRVYPMTLDRLRKRGKTWALLSEERDIDEPEDLELLNLED